MELTIGQLRNLLSNADDNAKLVFKTSMNDSISLSKITYIVENGLTSNDKSLTIQNQNKRLEIIIETK